jgi:hypothetical protein
MTCSFTTYMEWWDITNENGASYLCVHSCGVLNRGELVITLEWQGKRLSKSKTSSAKPLLLADGFKLCCLLPSKAEKDLFYFCLLFVQADLEIESFHPRFLAHVFL